MEDCELHDVSDLLTQRVVEGVGPNGGRVRNVMMGGGGGGSHQLLELQGTFTHVAVEMKLPDGHWKDEVVIAKAPHEFDGHGHTCFFQYHGSCNTCSVGTKTAKFTKRCDTGVHRSCVIASIKKPHTRVQARTANVCGATA